MAGNLQSVGFHDLVFGPIEVLFGPNGTTTRFRVTCDRIAPLIGYYNYVITFGASGTFKGLDVGLDGTTGAEVKELEIELPGLVNNLSSVINELFFDKWELLANESSETIFANPRLVTGIGSAYPVLNYNDKVVLSRLARDGGTVDSAVASCNADISSGNLQAPAIGYGAFGGAAVAGIFQKPGSLSSHDAYGGTAPGQLALEVLKGQTEYEKPGMVLRHTSYCSAGSTYNASTAHAMQIYTPAQLLTEVGSGWTYNLPPRIYSKIAGIAFEYAALHEQPYYTWGWLKKITREPVLANFMVEVSTEYVLGLWSNLRYATR